MINVFWKKVLGHWYLDVSLNRLQKIALQQLLRKEAALNGRELQFIRKFLEMSKAKFGRVFAMNAEVVEQWENEDVQLPWWREANIRLYAMNRVCGDDREFRKFFTDMNIRLISRRRKHALISIDCETLRVAS